MARKVKPWPTALHFGVTAEQAEAMWPRDPDFRPDKIRLARQARGYTMRDLAERAGISARRVSELEHNRDAATADEREALSHALYFPVSFFARPDIVIDFRNTVSGRCRFGAPA